MRIPKPVGQASLAALFISCAMGQAPPSPPKPDAPREGPSTAYQRAARLPARITSFTANPESIQPGQSTTLIWATENPNGITLEPGIGRVTSRGSMQVSPAATTTYTLRVRASGNTEVTKTVTVSVAGTQPVAASAPAETVKKEVPRMPDGKPDLSGVYNSSFGGPNTGGQNNPNAAKLKPGAEKFKVVRGPNDPGQYADCMPTGVPGAYFVPYQWEIVQGRDHVVILYEYPGIHRVIPLTVRAHQADLDPTWMGDSIGHWEGDTLVVDTIGFNDKTELPGGFKHTEALHVVERFSRPTFEGLHYEATVEDPNVFEKPWTIVRTFPLRPELQKIDEFVCENNHDYTPLFKKP